VGYIGSVMWDGALPIEIFPKKFVIGPQTGFHGRTLPHNATIYNRSGNWA